MVKNPPAIQETQVQSLGWKDPLEKGMAIFHSGILAWRIPWTEEPGGLQSMGSQRIEHYWVTNVHSAFILLVSVAYRTLLMHSKYSKYLRTRAERMRICTIIKQLPGVFNDCQAKNIVNCVFDRIHQRNYLGLEFLNLQLLFFNRYRVVQAICFFLSELS